MDSYEQKKQKLLTEFNTLKDSEIIAINKKTSNLFRERKKSNKKRINVKNFNKIISIDSKNLVAEVEGMITYENLVSSTLKYSLMPAVVPQLKMITLGGAISGIGIESSSFKYGLVHETVLEMEILLGNREIVLATPKNKYKDLFYSIPNSYGTLGYILKAKIKLVPVKKYVKIEHVKFNNPKKYYKELKKLCKDKNYDFIDGTIFSSDEMYITLGTFSDTAPIKSNYKYLNIYYKSIQINRVDYLDVKDYIWRWDSDWFWCSKVFFMQNKFLRILFGKFMLNSKAYLKLKKFNERFKITKFFSSLKSKLTKKVIVKEPIIQDVAIPIEKCTDFIKFFQDTIMIKPVWICPTKAYNHHKFPLFETNPRKLYVDFGFWDFIETKKQIGYYNKLIEKKVEKLKGKKSLYSSSYYDKKEFRKIFNGKYYDKVKKKYDPDKRFLTLYEKCVLRR